MSSGVKETACTSCVHLKVCSYKTQFLAAQKAVDNLTIGTGDRLSDISWIRPAKLECLYFLGRPPAMMDVAQSAALIAGQGTRFSN